MNLAMLVTIIERHVLKIDSHHLDFQHYIGVKLNAVLDFIVKFFLPPLVLNYFLIFRQKRYEFITKQYKSYNGKLAVTYIIIIPSCDIDSFSFSRQQNNRIMFPLLVRIARRTFRK